MALPRRRRRLEHALIEAAQREETVSRISAAARLSANALNDF
jgi:hypothetical protein